MTLAPPTASHALQHKLCSLEKIKDFSNMSWDVIWWLFPPDLVGVQDISPWLPSISHQGSLRFFHAGFTSQTTYFKFNFNRSSNTRLLLCVFHRVTKRPPTPQKRWPSRTPQPSTRLPHRMAFPQSLRHLTRSRRRTTPGRAGCPSTPWPSTRPHRHTASRPALTTARPPPRPHRSVSFTTCKHCSQHAVSK